MSVTLSLSLSVTSKPLEASNSFQTLVEDEESEEYNLPGKIKELMVSETMTDLLQQGPVVR